MKSEWIRLVLAGIVGGVIACGVQVFLSLHVGWFNVAGHIIAANDFALKDGQGRTIGEFKSGPDGTPIFYLRSTLTNTGAYVSILNGYPLLGFEDENGKSRLTLGLAKVGGMGPEITFADAKGNPRIILGKVPMVTSAGQKKETSESAISLFDDKQNVIWTEPPEYEVRGQITVK